MQPLIDATRDGLPVLVPLHQRKGGGEDGEGVRGSGAIAGTADIVRARLSEAEPEELAALNRYTVRKGETLLTIARKLQVNRVDLAEANYLSTKARLRAGQQLIIPRAPTLLLAAHADTPTPVAESRSVDAAVATRGVVPQAERTEESRLVHRVKRGETLASIARIYDTTVASLKQVNRLRSSGIRPGQRLTILTTRHLVATN